MREDLANRLRGLSAARRALLERLLLARAETAPGAGPIPRRDPSRACPLSPFQERIWFLERLAPAVPLYYRTWAARLAGPLDLAALQAALDAVVARHEVLRMAVHVAGGTPAPVFHASRPVPIVRRDLSRLDPDAREAAVHRVLGEEARTPFHLAREPLLRVTVLRLAEAAHVLALTLHHLVTDDWSMRLLLHELALGYAGAVTGVPPALPALPVQFGDVAVWQRERLASAPVADDVAYWRARLAGAPPVLALPADRPRPARLSHRGATRTDGLGVSLSRRLRETSRAEGVSPFTLLLAAFVVLLGRYTDRDDVVLGIPMTGRDRPELEPVIGPLIDTAALRVDLAGLGSFREVLARTRAAVAGAAAHRLLPFERLVDILRPERALDHTPVFQVMLGWVEPGSLLQSLRLPGVTATPVGVDRGSAKVDLTLLLTEMEEEIVGEAEYSTDLFDGETVGRMLGHFRTLLEGIVADPAAPPWRLPLMAAAERERVLVAWNDTRRPYPADRTVHALVAEQAAASPEAVAVVAGDRALTYGELDRRADQLARHLRARGVGPEVPVAIAVERSPEMVVGLLGILRAGGAYVPLDPADPRERLAFLLADTGAPVVLTLARLRERLPAGAPGTRVICLDADWPAIAQEAGPPPEDRATPDTLAYVTYTSGSTGRPKGVCVPHRGIVRLVRNADYARLDPGEVCLQLAPLAFDASTFEIWGSLLNGARLVLHPAEPPSPAGLARVVRRHGVTTLWLTAALFHEVVDGAPGGLPPVRQLLAGGDVLSPRHVGRVLREWPGVRLVNGYGPTENTTFTCCHTVTAADLERPSVPIGRPIANTRVYVLDRHGEPVPVGVPGELHAAGDGLARGYLNCPDLTAERFVPDPWSGAPGARLYRTGDLVRWRPDGTLEFLGRTDAQVKVRGFRVEPGEVEAALGQHPAVREAVVTAREDRPGERRLVAYLVPREGPEAGPSGLRRFLAERLPAHMIPAAFVTLTALPLTPTGKVDRSALPAPEPAPVEGSAPAGPMTPGEALVARVWAELLERPDVRARDDFFALGGHSLLATRLVARLEEALGFEVPVALVFEAPTVAGLAARLQALGPLPGGGARAG